MAAEDREIQYDVVITKKTMAKSPREALQIVLDALKQIESGINAGAIVEVFDQDNPISVMEEEI